MLKIGQLLLETLQNSCIKIKDVRFIAMYDEYMAMNAQNLKKAYIASVLAHKYGISERQFFYIIKRLRQDCKISAA